MEIKTDINSNFDKKKSIGSENFNTIPQQPSNRNSYPLIAGLLLIIGGIIGIIFWIQMYIIDTSMIELILNNINQIQGTEVLLAEDQIIGFLQTCAVIGMIISVFPILGGILAVQKKLYYISIVGSIIGLFSIGIVFLSSILSLIGLILLVLSKQEFQ